MDREKNGCMFYGILKLHIAIMSISPPLFRRDERSSEDRRDDRRDDRDNRRRDDRDYIPRDDREGRKDYSSSTRGRDDDSRLVYIVYAD